MQCSLPRKQNERTSEPRRDFRRSIVERHRHIGNQQPWTSAGPKSGSDLRRELRPTRTGVFRLGSGNERRRERTLHRVVGIARRVVVRSAMDWTHAVSRPPADRAPAARRLAGGDEASRTKDLALSQPKAMGDQRRVIPRKCCSPGPRPLSDVQAARYSVLTVVGTGERPTPLRRQPCVAAV